MDPAAFHVDFAEVERIELTKGGFDASRQGGMGGMVNILRKRPGPGLHFRPTVQTGSFGFYNPSLTGSAGDEKLEFLAGYSYRTSSQFRDAEGRRMTQVGGYLPAAATDSAFGIHTGWTNFRFSPAPNHSGEVTFTRQHGSGVLYPYLSMDSPYDIADRASANYDLRAPFTGVRAIGLRSYYTRVRHWMTDERRVSSAGALDRFSMATFAKTRTTGGQVDMDLEHGISAGIEAYQRNWDAVNSFRTRMMNLDQHIIPNVNTTFFGSYATADRAIGRFRIGGGARLDTAAASVRSDRFNPALFAAYKGGIARERRDTNPTGNVRVAFSATSWLELFTGVASTVRIPDAQERFLNHRRGGTDWVGDPSLDPARNSEFNLGGTIRRGRSYVKLLGYWSEVDGYIVVHNQARRVASPGIVNVSARSYANVDTQLRGGEFGYGAALTSRWVLSGGMGYTRATKAPRPEIGILDRNVAEIPPLRGRTSLRYGTRKWFAEAESLASSRQSKGRPEGRRTYTNGDGDRRHRQHCEPPVLRAPLVSA
jgi:iron complex outermembrane receptor protein